MPERDRWRVLNFCNPRNEINAWAKAQGVDLRAKLNARVRHIETLTRPPARADGVGLLRKAGPCQGHKLIEIVITIGKKEYRPIGCYGPGEADITLLLGALEKGGEFVEPRNACVQAVNRKRLVMSDSRRYTVEHEFD